jgi:hypothetical protein
VMMRCQDILIKSEMKRLNKAISDGQILNSRGMVLTRNTEGRTKDENTSNKSFRNF